mmetsp:Transcript_17148/g.39932  ORF Transcript_17148/g.39932 Transcript_17148/m.39932 type:complete len:122 (-) Transcript_17148:176-541(-)
MARQSQYASSFVWLCLTLMATCAHAHGAWCVHVAPVLDTVTMTGTSVWPRTCCPSPGLSATTTGWASQGAVGYAANLGPWIAIAAAAGLLYFTVLVFHARRQAWRRASRVPFRRQRMALCS